MVLRTAVVAGLRKLDCHRVPVGQVCCMLAGRTAVVLAGRTAVVLAGRTVVVLVGRTAVVPAAVRMQLAGRRETVKGVVLREAVAMGTVMLCHRYLEDAESSGTGDYCCRRDTPGMVNSRETWRATGGERGNVESPDKWQAVVGEAE
jgi:hypothetical protein